MEPPSPARERFRPTNCSWRAPALPRLIRSTSTTPSPTISTPATGQVSDIAVHTGSVAVHIKGDFQETPQAILLDLHLSAPNLPVDQLEQLLPVVGSPSAQRFVSPRRHPHRDSRHHRPRHRNHHRRSRRDRQLAARRLRSRLPHPGNQSIRRQGRRHADPDAAHRREQLPASPTSSPTSTPTCPRSEPPAATAPSLPPALSISNWSRNSAPPQEWAPSPAKP